ncbi:hypothetical protein [Actinopolymorpha alba]|uniref:zinc finger domain-containing protein n=1 Tax=Actinopolymorpha alba TaxID=533267 RepID=UPI0003770F55|nr:hypothetical protein [Actinopolymorpha alba]
MNDENLIDSGRLDWVFDGHLAARYGYTTADLATLARVLSRPCPHCSAEPGLWCMNTRSGGQLEGLDNQHLARRHLR